MYCIVMYQEKTYQIGFEQKTCISAVFHSLFYIQAHVKRAPEVIVQKKNLCGSIKGEIKLWWPDKTIIVHVNLLESVFSAVAAIGLCHLLQTDQSILVQIKAEEVFHRSLLDQIVGEESTVSLGDRFMQWSLSSSSVWAEFAEFTPAISFPDQIGYCSFTIATKKVTSTATQPPSQPTMRPNWAATGRWQVWEEKKKQKREQHHCIGCFTQLIISPCPHLCLLGCLTLSIYICHFILCLFHISCFQGLVATPAWVTQYHKCRKRRDRFICVTLLHICFLSTFSCTTIGELEIMLAGQATHSEVSPHPSFMFGPDNRY